MHEEVDEDRDGLLYQGELHFFDGLCLMRVTFQLIEKNAISQPGLSSFMKISEIVLGGILRKKYSTKTIKTSFEHRCMT